MDWVPLGKITKPHGLKGEVKYIPAVADPDIFKGIRQVRLTSKNQSFDAMEIESVRGFNPNAPSGKWILKLRGTDTVEQARTLCGCEVSARREDFPKLPPDEYYRFEIEGLEVYDTAGKFYGRIKEIIETGSNDVYVVRDGHREVLLPMIDSVVQSIDLQAGRLVFQPIEGLLEDSPV